MSLFQFSWLCKEQLVCWPINRIKITRNDPPSRGTIKLAWFLEGVWHITNFSHPERGIIMGILRDTLFPPNNNYNQAGKQPDNNGKGEKRYNNPYLDQAIFLRCKLREQEYRSRLEIERLESEIGRLKRVERQYRKI